MTQFRIEEDGVKLGWNLVLMALTLGLGIYMANYVAPLEEQLAVTKKEMKLLTERVTRLEDKVDSHLIRRNEVVVP